MPSDCSLSFSSTPPITASLLRRYLACFDGKLAFFCHQLRDLAELINNDTQLNKKFCQDTQEPSLHFGLDKLLMQVLKTLLQGIDEGMADLLDELEDACYDQPDISNKLKKVIFEFQKQSFEKRDLLNQEYKQKSQESGSKSSIAWFDEFFGDVAPLRKNPTWGEQTCEGNESGSTRLENGWKLSKINIPEFEPCIPHQNIGSFIEGSKFQDNLSSMIPAEESSMRSPSFDRNFQIKDSKLQSERNSSFERPWTMRVSNDNFDQTKLQGAQSVNPTLEQPPKKKRSLDLQKENLTFEDIFSLDRYEVDGSIVYSIFAESPNSLLVSTDNKKLYRFRLSSKQAEIICDRNNYIYDIKKDCEGRIIIAEESSVYLLQSGANSSTGGNEKRAEAVCLGEYSSYDCGLCLQMSPSLEKVYFIKNKSQSKTLLETTLSNLSTSESSPSSNSYIFPRGGIRQFLALERHLYAVDCKGTVQQVAVDREGRHKPTHCQTMTHSQGTLN